jgi:hypothetical protein
MRDGDVRRAVLSDLSARHSDDRETRIVEEMGVWSGSARIDVAVINGELSGFELKSDRDTLGRLETQAEIYGHVFDRVTLVVGSKHAKKALALIPDWWSVVVASADGNRISLNPEREGSLNPNQRPELIAELLRKEEALDLLACHGLDCGWRSKRVRLIYERLAQCLPFDALKAGVRDALKAREGWLRQSRADQFDVAIDANTDPVLETLRL